MTAAHGPAATVAALRSAAARFRNGIVDWGKEDFRTQGFGEPVPTCCALGGISDAIDPENGDGDPRWVDPYLRPIAVAAMEELADYLVTETDTPDKGFRTVTGWERDPVEVVGDWNDAEGRTVDDVVAALEAAADRLALRDAPGGDRMTAAACPVCRLPLGDGDRVTYGAHPYCKRGNR